MISNHEEGGEETAPPLPRSWDEVRKACHRWLMERDAVYRAEHRGWHDRRVSYARRMKKLKAKA